MSEETDPRNEVFKFTYEQLVDFMEEYGGCSIRCNDEPSFFSLLEQIERDGGVVIERKAREAMKE